MLLLMTAGSQFFSGSANCLATPRRETSPHFRVVSGFILTQQNERLPGVTVIVRGSFWDARTTSDREGYFRFDVPVADITIRFEGKNIQPLERSVGRNELSENLEIKVNVVIAPIQGSVVIQDTTLNPTIDQRNDTIYKNTLFERDDQLVESLNAGINAGQHEGGGNLPGLGPSQNSIDTTIEVQRLAVMAYGPMPGCRSDNHSRRPWPYNAQAKAQR